MSDLQPTLEKWHGYHRNALRKAPSSHFAEQSFGINNPVWRDFAAPMPNQSNPYLTYANHEMLLLHTHWFIPSKSLRIVCQSTYLCAGVCLWFYRIVSLEMKWQVWALQHGVTPYTSSPASSLENGCWDIGWLAKELRKWDCVASCAKEPCGS